MKKLIVFLIVLISTSIYISCDSNTVQEISPVVTNPNYVDNVQTVFTNKCAGCHKNGSQTPYLENYAEVKDAIENGTVLCRINGTECGGIMPTDGKMSQVIIDMIQKWADQGFNEQSPKPTYTANIQNVFNAKCTSCHSNGSQDPNLETYLEVKDAIENGTVLCRINGTDNCGAIMPTSGKMPQATLDIIQLWVDQGYAQ